MPRPLAALALALVGGAPAWALTPEELWSAWRAEAAGFGATLDAEATPGADGSLALRGWTLALPGEPPNAIPPDSPIQGMTLRPVGGGAVAIDLGLPPDGVHAFDGGRVEYDGLAFTARDDEGGGAGVEGGIVYEVAARATRWSFPSPPDAPPGAPPDAPPDAPRGGDATLELAGPAARFSGGVGAGRTAALDLSIDGYAFTLDLDGPPDAGGLAARLDGPLTLSLAVTAEEGATLSGLQAAMEPGGDPDTELSRLLDAGLAMRLGLSFGAITQTLEVEGTGPGGPPFSLGAVIAVGPGGYSLAFDRSAVAIRSDYRDLSVTATSSHLPFPRLDLSIARAGADLRLPIGAEVGEFRYRLTLEDLVAGEDAWAFLDPQGFLPRGPLSVAWDLGGRMAFDVAAMEAAEAAGAPPPPPTVESLEIGRIEVAGVGLRVTGSGSFVVADPVVPIFSGRAGARVEGLDGLIDALVRLGVLTEADARNARLALAMYFRAGDGPDVRETAVEARPDGTMLVNGMRVE